MPISLGFLEWGCPKRGSLPSFFLFTSLPPFSRTFHFNFASSPLYNLRALNRLLYFCLIIVIILDIFTPNNLCQSNHRSKYCKNPSADWQMSTPVQAGTTTLSLLVIVVIVIIIIIYFIHFFLYFNICTIIYHVPHV